MQLFNQNYFELFAIPESFEVSLELLTDRYRSLQSQWHPDRFASFDEQKKLQAVQMSSWLNQAYDVLKTPLSRAAYLLKLRSCDIETVLQQDLGADLLMEQMLLREALEELPENESALDTLEALKKEVRQEIQECEQSFSAQIEINEIAAAKKFFHKLQFLVKLLKEIEIKEENRLGY